MNIYTPYTYLIGWTHSNKYYYGVRYAQGCHPNDLWKKYFTSSKHVKKYTKKHGDPDVIQIRKTFDNSDDARLWEHKVLLKLNVKGRDDFLNHSNGKAPPITNHKRSENFGLYSEKGPRGSVFEQWGEDTAKKWYKNMRPYWEAKKGNQYGKDRLTTDLSRQKYKESAYKKWSNPEYAQKVNSHKHKKTTIKGKSFNSRLDAAKYFGVTTKTITRWLKKSNL